MTATMTPDISSSGYDRLAEVYDRVTAHHDLVHWTGTLKTKLEATVGARLGTRLLDVGCGTGRSTTAWAAHGFDVTGVDASRPMLDQARKLYPTHSWQHADAREIPENLRGFDIVSLLGDVVNHVSDVELEDVFAASRRALKPGGALVFDANTLFAFREHFSATVVTDLDADVVLWRGETPTDLAAGGVARLALELLEGLPSGVLRRHRSVLHQQHHPSETVVGALDRAGLRLLGAYGQDFAAVLEQPVDENRHTKTIFIALRDAATTERR